MSNKNTGDSFWLTLDEGYCQAEFDVTPVVGKNSSATGRIVLRPRRKLGAQAEADKETRDISIRVFGSPNVGNRVKAELGKSPYVKPHPENVLKSKAGGMSDSPLSQIDPKHEKKVRFRRETVQIE